MKVLVLATDYPNNEGSVKLQYIHTRNVEYIKNRIDVTVLNFSAEKNYNIDGIEVITLKEYREKFDKAKFNILISHAANLKNHIRFLNQFKSRFKNIVFFFHGHEVLRESDSYPKPFNYMSTNNKIKKYARDIYDTLKFKIIKRFIVNNKEKIDLIFVSKWMKDEFDKNLQIDSNDYPAYHIIYNSVGRLFEENTYNPQKTNYDYITVRSNIDGSKYCVDIIYKLALLMPNKEFLLIGKGDFFKHYDKPSNLTFIEKQLTHLEILDYLNKSRFALMPTRTDSQGVMSCEFTAFGIPLITSDIDVCKQVFENVDNVWLISNEDIDEKSLETLPEHTSIEVSKSTKFSLEKTVYKEIQLFKNK